MVGLLFCRCSLSCNPIISILFSFDSLTWNQVTVVLQLIETVTWNTSLMVMNNLFSLRRNILNVLLLCSFHLEQPFMALVKLVVLLSAPESGYTLALLRYLLSAVSPSICKCTGFRRLMWLLFPGGSKNNVW